ncbi:MAG: hypothetical protein ABFQ95_02500 [Pseudomonadota bacterium]
MRKLCLLSVVLVVQVFCSVGDDCSATHTQDFSEQSEPGKTLLTLASNSS